MMYGLDETYDAVFYVGYHAPAGDPGSPSAIRLRGASNFIELNGKRMSEFMLNTYHGSHVRRAGVVLIW